MSLFKQLNIYLFASAGVEDTDFDSRLKNTRERIREEFGRQYYDYVVLNLIQLEDHVDCVRSIQEFAIEYLHDIDLNKDSRLYTQRIETRDEIAGLILNFSKEHSHLFLMNYETVDQTIIGRFAYTTRFGIDEHRIRYWDIVKASKINPGQLEECIEVTQLARTRMDERIERNYRYMNNFMKFALSGIVLLCLPLVWSLLKHFMASLNLLYGAALLLIVILSYLILDYMWKQIQSLEHERKYYM